MVLAALVVAPVAAAAPAANDTHGGAESIASAPFAATVDTTEATTDADDVEANQNCGAPRPRQASGTRMRPAPATR